MVVKRKREFYATPVSNDQDAATSTPDVLSDTVPVTLSPFTIEYTKPGDTKPKKPRASVKSAINSNDHTTTKQEQGVEATDPPVSYMVMPGSMWESMKKYKNFIGMLLLYRRSLQKCGADPAYQSLINNSE